MQEPQIPSLYLAEMNIFHVHFSALLSSTNNALHVTRLSHFCITKCTCFATHTHTHTHRSVVRSGPHHCAHYHKNYPAMGLNRPKERDCQLSNLGRMSATYGLLSIVLTIVTPRNRATRPVRTEISRNFLHQAVSSPVSFHG